MDQNPFKSLSCFHCQFRDVNSSGSREIWGQPPLALHAYISLMLDLKKKKKNHWFLHITGVMGCKGWIQTQPQLSIGSKKRAHTHLSFWGTPNFYSSFMRKWCQHPLSLISSAKRVQKETEAKVNDIQGTVEAAIKIQMKTTQH